MPVEQRPRPSRELRDFLLDLLPRTHAAIVHPATDKNAPPPHHPRPSKAPEVSHPGERIHLVADVLTQRALNRATLARQLLLTREPRPILDTIEHLIGLQAQAPQPPYYGLWSRIDGFTPDQLSTLITNRDAVRIALMRGTIHLVSARDCLQLRPLFQTSLDRWLTTAFGRQLPGVDLDAVTTHGRTLVETTPLTFDELGKQLAPHWPDATPQALAQVIRGRVPLVQVPPRGLWGAAGAARHTSAETWLGQPLDPAPSIDQLVLRYLNAFGPATVKDIQTWSGLTRLREVTTRLAPHLRAFRGEDGAELYDLPEAPRPDPDTPAPCRLVAEFDNLVLSHADRTRVMTDADRKRFFTVNGIFPGVLLLDGRCAGTWRITREREAITLAFTPYRKLTAAEIDDVTAEGHRLLDFATSAPAPEAATAASPPFRQLRFEALR
ncbi:AlkZ family DNA glycosylase [Streptosporangiaceae bacterium NEAU-GS5]|nr:AlkZ family DNA glycosylase [Streptosporangiaceae bacterium NEAU-GS5]